MAPQIDRQAVAPTVLRQQERWKKIGYTIADLIYSMIGIGAFCLFWQYILVPAGLKELQGFQIAALVLVGGYLNGAVRIMAGNRSALYPRLYTGGNGELFYFSPAGQHSLSGYFCRETVG